MRELNSFRMDVDRKFPHLHKAPIVEAVIHWQASPSRVLDRENVKKELEQRFCEFSLRDQQPIDLAMNLWAEGVEPRQQIRWNGFRLESTDQKYIGQLMLNAVVFSRLAPYENWPTFVAKAVRFWDAFVELAAPVTVERLSVRFISQIELKEQEQASDVVKEPSAMTESIGLRPNTFFRQDTMEVPDYPYRVNLVRAIQCPQPPIIPKKLLFVDINIFTTGPINVNKATIEQHLKEMRFLKNFVFFSFTKNAEQRFGGE